MTCLSNHPESGVSAPLSFYPINKTSTYYFMADNINYNTQTGQHSFFSAQAPRFAPELIYPGDGQVAEIELVYKTRVKVADRKTIYTSTAAAHLFRQQWNENTLELQEEMKVLFLNRANHVLAFLSLCAGGMTGTVADIRLIMIAALRTGAHAILLCHNHPSGNLQPSKADMQLTQQIKDAARLLDMRLADHIILTRESHYSFMDEGVI